MRGDAAPPTALTPASGLRVPRGGPPGSGALGGVFLAGEDAEEPLPLRLRAKEGEEGMDVLVAVVAASMLLSSSDLLLLVPSWRVMGVVYWSPTPALQGEEHAQGKMSSERTGTLHY